MSPGPSYGQVVTAAADEAGSYGFVTEQSGPASDFAPSVAPASLEYNYDYLRTGMFASLQDFLSYAISVNTTFDPITFESTYYDGFLDVMNDLMVLPLREGATAEQFLGCVGCYFQVDVPVRNDAYPTTPFDPATDPLLAMDVQLFLDELEASVLMPMLDTQDLFNEYRTVTRLYTTLSAIEMTEDPVFDFNPDLEPVNNVHTGERLIQCDGRQQITLPQGIVLDTDGSTWPVTIDDELPMNLRLLQLSTEGEGDVVLDNTDRVADGLLDLGIGSLAPLVAPPEDDDGMASASDDDASDDDASDDDAPAADDDASDDDEAGDDDMANAESDAAGDDGCGCRVAGAPAAPRGVLLVLGSILGLAFSARRRRSRTPR
jgi:MYXO-CTERM domain-containing protein